MYDHHRQSIDNLISYFDGDPDVIAIVLGGSVAKGLARPDSDIDAIIVVTDERHAALTKENRLSECITGHCTYEGGYFDLKYTTKAYLKAVAEHGSEPSRNAFVSAQCLVSRDEEIAVLLEQVPVFQQSEKPDKLLSFYSALVLNNGYFWNVSKDNPYLRLRAVGDIVLFGIRLLLQDREVLFPCHKALLQTVSRLSDKPEDIMGVTERFLSIPTNETRKAFVELITSSISFKPPEDFSHILTRYVEDNELWWYKHRPNIAEW